MARARLTAAARARLMAAVRARLTAAARARPKAVVRARPTAVVKADEESWVGRREARDDQVTRAAAAMAVVAMGLAAAARARPTAAAVRAKAEVTARPTAAAARARPKAEARTRPAGVSWAAMVKEGVEAAEWPAAQRTLVSVLEPRVRRGQVRRGTNHKRLVRQTPMSQGRYGFFYAKYDEKAWCDGGRFRASTAARTLARRPGEFERQGRAGAGRG